MVPEGNAGGTTSIVPASLGSPVATAFISLPSRAAPPGSNDVLAVVALVGFVPWKDSRIRARFQSIVTSPAITTRMSATGPSLVRPLLPPDHAVPGLRQDLRDPEHRVAIQLLDVLGQLLPTDEVLLLPSPSFPEHPPRRGPFLHPPDVLLLR